MRFLRPSLAEFAEDLPEVRVRRVSEQVLLMRPHTWPRFSFGAWLKTASERLHRNKLAVALANKLARIAWRVLRHEKPFDTNTAA
jgi:hypothetical protein